MKFSDLNYLTNRVQIATLLEEKKVEGIGIEIGVAEGHHSRAILETWKSCKQFHGVDPYCTQDPTIWSDNFSANTIKHNFNLANKVVSDYPKFALHKAYSIEAAKLFQPRMFDYIYIDGNHDYPAVVEDLNTWWPLLKTGGIFAGHDYAPRFNGIIRAVDDFITANHLQMKYFVDCTSWAVVNDPNAYEFELDYSTF